LVVLLKMFKIIRVIEKDLFLNKEIHKKCTIISLETIPKFGFCLRNPSI